MRDYNEELTQLIKDAIADGYIAWWVDRCEGNDCEITDPDKDAPRSVWFEKER